jgi:zinc transport system substrate-binding protein
MCPDSSGLHTRLSPSSLQENIIESQLGAMPTSFRAGMLRRITNQQHGKSGKNKRMKTLLNLSVALLTACLITGCKQSLPPADQSKLQVVTTLFPLYDFSRQIAGDKAQITLLLPPGVEPHSFEPRPGDIITINKADVFIYTGPFMEAWVQDVLGGVNSRKLLVIDASKGIQLSSEQGHEGEVSVNETEHNHGGMDPHIWVDPVLARQIVNTIAEGFAAQDPTNKDFYLARAKAYIEKLAALDTNIRQTLQPCKTKTILYGGHFAFGYFARRYGLDYISPYAGFSPDAEPTPRKITELIEKMKALNSKYIFYEELLEPRVARTIAESTGAKLLLLHGTHNISKEELEGGAAYLEIMEGNLQRLKLALNCE